MRLEHDLAIRREVRDILAADVALGVGDGWHQLVGRALVKIREVTDGKVAVRQVKERHGLLSIFTDVMIRGSDTVSQRVFDATNGAADESAFVCEMCGNSGRLIATDRARVRCQACQADDPERERVWREHRDDIWEAAATYVRVCLEHDRLFPVANIVMRTCIDDRDHRLFLDEVHDRLVWWRAGSWLEGVDEALRDGFRRLDFAPVRATAEEWEVVRALYPEDFVESDKRQALIEDQRKRRAGEIRSAALAYVRECAREHRVLDIEQFGQRRWRQDGEPKRRVMIDALIDDVRSGIPVVDVWQRYEVNGLIARQLVGAASYGDLYRILRDNRMPIGFRPADVTRWAAEGKIPRADVGEIFGIEASEIDAFISAWSAGEN